jgi:HK97 family phage major capsid protein
LAEDLAIQNGSGALSGILQNAVGYSGSRTNLVERIIDAMLVQLANNHHTANAIVLSNEAYSEVVLNAASGSGEFDLPAVVTVDTNGTLRILGRPVFSNSYLDQEGIAAIIGDWNEAQLLMRSAPRFRVFEQNNDDAEKNVLLFRIEERIALPIFYDNAFVTINAAS